MNIAVIGLSHKNAAVEIREKLSIPEPEIEGAIACVSGYPHVEEVAILSTCNRLEIYLVASETEPCIREVMQFLCDKSGVALAELRSHLFVLLHQDAITHLMRVASGLESLVLGEGQILSQVKTTHKWGQRYKGVGRILNQLFKQSISIGKRVRTETNIGTGAVSISSAAVELAQMQVENLADYRISIVGAGKMSRLLVQHLISKGAQQINIINRSTDRAEELAKKFDTVPIQVHPLTEMMSVVAASDMVFTSTGATEPILDRAKLEGAIDGNSSLMLFDISVPRNVAADVSEMDNVRSFNVDDLKAVVAQNHETRRQMAMEAQLLIEAEVDAFEQWWRSLETVPTISCLRKKIESIREQELEKALSRLGTEFADKHQETIEALTRGIVNKILHDPMVQLRAQQDIEARRRAMHTLHQLFDLDPIPQNQ